MVAVPPCLGVTDWVPQPPPGPHAATRKRQATARPARLISSLHTLLKDADLLHPSLFRQRGFTRAHNEVGPGPRGRLIARFGLRSTIFPPTTHADPAPPGA